MKTWVIVCLAAGAALAAGSTAITLLMKHKKTAGSQEVIDRFSAEAEVFTGLYEPMRMIRDGVLTAGKEVFSDWDTRIHNLDNSPALVGHWDTAFASFESWDSSEYVKKSDELLALAQKAGIVRGEETSVTVERSVFKRYNTKNGVRIEPGATAKVETPFWTVGGRVLEKGVLIKEEEEEN